jgi:hypothetical protein
VPKLNIREIKKINTSLELISGLKFQDQKIEIISNEEKIMRYKHYIIEIYIKEKDETRVIVSFCIFLLVLISCFDILFSVEYFFS